MTSISYDDRIALAKLTHVALLAVSAKADALTRAHLDHAQATSASTENLWLGSGGHDAAEADPVIQALRAAEASLEAARVSIMSIQTEA